MSVLNAKLRRELLGGAGALSTVVAIIAVGTGSFIGLGSAQRMPEQFVLGVVGTTYLF